MENVINMETFIQHLAYFIKMGIYINKGTDKEEVLERCIKLYNKYKSIEMAKEISGPNEIFVRKCVKRLNLVLKVDDKLNPVDFRRKENQLRMSYFNPHNSIESNDMESMIDYATDNKIDILNGVELMFFLRESKYRDLLWQYTRSLFYISQILVSKYDPNCDPNDGIIIRKQQVIDMSIEMLETILVEISETEEKIKLSQVMAVDKFLNVKLIKADINKKNVEEAREEVKEIFMKKGLGEDGTMTKLVDFISDDLVNIDLEKGNIVQSMFGIAQNVAEKMRGDLEGNPDKFKSTIGAITEVFQEAMEDSSKSGHEIPDDLKNLFNQVLSASPLNKDYNGASEEEIAANLEGIIEASGMDKDSFYQSIRDGDGNLDTTKLEGYLGRMV